MYSILKLLGFSTCLLAVTCQQQISPKSPVFLSHFQRLPAVDTLHVEVSSENDAPSNGDSIPNALFFKEVPQKLLLEIDYIADSVQAQVSGRGSFQLNDSITAYWVEIRQFWFQHHSLFLYNKSQNAFTDRVTLAEFYGGDGGQVLIGSWLFDYDGDGKKDILRREIQHSIIPGDEDVIERTEHSAGLLLWRNGRFVEMPLQDTAAAIKRFPIRGF